MARRRTIAATLCAAVALAACGHPGTGREGVPGVARADECATPAPVAARDTVVVALTEPVDPAHAPAGNNDAERVVFAQLYETLVRVSCAGRIVPGAASRWRHDTGTVWSFEVGRLDRAATAWRGAGRAGLGIASMQRATDTLRVAFSGFEVGPPAWLADRRLALVGPADTSGWPMPTGAFALVAGGQSPVIRPQAPGRFPIVRFIARTGTDPRDLLDGGLDLLVTRDTAAITYASRLADFAAVPLEWDRTYVLVTRRATATSRDTAVPRAEREALARDVVPGAARAAAGPFWWEGGRGCAATGGPRTSAGADVVYPAGDAVAEALAERIVALATQRTRPGWLSGIAATRPLTARAVEGTALAHTLGNGVAAAVILRLPVVEPASRCLDDVTWRTDDAIAPLVDTRATALVRRETMRITTDRDGSLRILAGSAP